MIFSIFLFSSNTHGLLTLFRGKIECMEFVTILHLSRELNVPARVIRYWLIYH